MPTSHSLTTLPTLTGLALVCANCDLVVDEPVVHSCPRCGWRAFETRMPDSGPVMDRMRCEAHAPAQMLTVDDIHEVIEETVLARPRQLPVVMSREFKRELAIAIVTHIRTLARAARTVVARTT